MGVRYSACGGFAGARRFFLLLAVVTVFGCSVTATRPVQEMSNTEAAVRAAKDVNAESLAPDYFRRANDYYFKAKREYGLKNFENARKYALQAMKYAEEAEFQSIRKGGAAPDADSSDLQEGASPDADASFKQIPGEPTIPTENSKATPPPASSPAPNAAAPDNSNQGTDYNAAVRDQEEKRRQEEERKQQSQQQKTPAQPPAQQAPQQLPQGALGPQAPRTLLAQQFQTGFAPFQTGSAPSSVGGAPSSAGAAPTNVGGSPLLQPAPAAPQASPTGQSSTVIYQEQLPNTTLTPEPQDLNSDTSGVKTMDMQEPKDLFPDSTPTPSPAPPSAAPEQ